MMLLLLAVLATGIWMLFKPNSSIALITVIVLGIIFMVAAVKSLYALIPIAIIAALLYHYVIKPRLKKQAP